MVIILFLLMACSEEKKETPATDLDALRVKLDEKKEALERIQREITQLNQQISLLDPSLSEKARLVEIVKVEPQLFERFIEVQGTVTADERINVSAEIPGRITNLYVEEGDRISKGNKIASLDLEGLEKQIDEVETSLELANDVFARQERLWNQNIGSELQYLQAKNNKERLEKNLETLRYNLSKSILYAPLSGIIENEMLGEGEMALTGMPIVTILNTSKLRVKADIPERYIKLIQSNQDVEVIFPALDETHRGRITLIGTAIDPANRTIGVEIRLLDKSRFLKPNLLAEVKLREIQVENALVIPVEYVLQEVDGSSFVYTVNRSNNEVRAKKTYITTGEAYESRIVIQEGLQDGMELVTTGARNVSDGELIEVQLTNESHGN